MLYKDVQSCKRPWMCPECSKEVAKALQELLLLQEEVKSLRAESTGLKQGSTKIRALVTSLIIDLQATLRLIACTTHYNLQN